MVELTMNTKDEELANIFRNGTIICGFSYVVTKYRLDDIPFIIFSTSILPQQQKLQFIIDVEINRKEEGLSSILSTVFSEKLSTPKDLTLYLAKKSIYDKYDLKLLKNLLYEYNTKELRESIINLHIIYTSWNRDLFRIIEEYLEMKDEV